MVKKIVISRFNNIAAILQNSKIQELITVHNSYQVNDIYIGVVQKIFSSINAAFINLGKNGKSGFIHVSDIKHLKKSPYANKVTDILSINQLILVQIIKEPTINKGPRLTANINLFGKYLVLMPFCNSIFISHKIHDQNERIYLHSLAILLKPATMGILIRSAAQGKTEEVIIEDLRCLKRQWNFIEKVAVSTKLPSLIYKEEDLIKKIMYNSYEKNVNKIIIDSEDGLKQVQNHLQKWQCLANLQQINIQLYNKPDRLLEKFRIKHAILAALKPKVNLLFGGHIVIDNNEALTVIDVNSGSFNKSDNSQETILRTNFYAAIEISYQLKIRNINGVIIIDFIDMESPKDQLRLLEHFNQLLQLDEAKPQIIQLSQLGLVELTRRRRGQSLQELFSSQNHSYLNWDNNLVFRHNDAYYKNVWRNTCSIHKNIQSLFFTKRFRKKITLQNKKFAKPHNSQCKDHIFIDRTHVIHLVLLHRNYLVPFILYSNIIKL
uniref:Ribonuclease E n=1 Tax=Riquetophycus sp. TaxID=1897556 RepID=A0A1C9C887_9FLOR|nr:ribonuclease E [Riquetophycus sp.]